MHASVSQKTFYTNTGGRPYLFHGPEFASAVPDLTQQSHTCAHTHIHFIPFLLYSAEKVSFIHNIKRRGVTAKGLHHKVFTTIV